MKAYVKARIKGFSGKLDGAIYYYHPRQKRNLMRHAPKRLRGFRRFRRFRRFSAIGA